MTSTTSHTLRPGDILCGSWGYDQTNVSFYQVVRVTEKSARIRRIRSTHQDDCHVVPLKDQYASEEETTRRVSGHGEVRLSSYLHVSKWDGTPQYETPLNAGH